MIINNLDLGAHLTWSAPLQTRKGATWGATTQDLVVEGGQSITFSKSGVIRKRTETVWVTVNPPDSTKVLRLVRQLQELANNPNLQPVYIQWASGGGNIVVDQEDGWYTLEQVEPDLDITADGIVPVLISVSYLAPGLLSKALAVSYIGGPALIGWGGPAINWLSYPLNASGMPFQINRLGGEGYIPISYQLPMSVSTPQVFIPSGTISDLFKDRVYVFDTISTGSNPVPTAGAFSNANWLEVLHPDHQFIGDCVVTNGLLLLLFQTGQNRQAQIYFWNITNSQWQLFGNLAGNDSSSGASWTLRSYTLGRISHRECSIQLVSNSSNANWIQVVIRVISGAYYCRVQLKELTQTNTRADPLLLTSSTAPKISYTDTHVLDNTLTAEQVDMSLSGSTFGYSAAFANNSTLPCIFGWLYLDNTGQTIQGFASPLGLGIGDSHVLPLINQSRFYSLFVIPFLTPQSLQGEAETGTLGTGWSSVADAAASGGNAAKAANGSVSPNADTFGAAFIPPSGSYSFYVRVRAPGSGGSITFGIWDSNASVFIASSTVNVSSISTSYSWIQIVSAASLTIGQTIQFRAQIATTLGSDVFVDQASLVPVNLPALQNGPRDLFQQFGFDRQTRVISV